MYWRGVLERCLYWRDVCRATSVLEDTSISERCLYKRDVYTKEISV